MNRTEKPLLDCSDRFVSLITSVLNVTDDVRVSRIAAGIGGSNWLDRSRLRREAKEFASEDTELDQYNDEELDDRASGAGPVNESNSWPW